MGSGHSTSSSSSNVSPPTNISDSINETPYTINSTSYNKKALLIGINYTGTSNRLHGCINDSQNMKTLLENWGFTTTIMNDTSSGGLYPTKTNILTQMQNLITSLSSNDIGVIYYSGHGTRVMDTNGDEISNLDSVIVPINLNFIIDDEIRNILTQAVSNSKVFCVFDSCNSGSVCDLRYNVFDTSYKENPGDKSSSLIYRNKVIENTNYPNTNAHLIIILK